MGNRRPTRGRLSVANRPSAVALEHAVEPNIDAVDGPITDGDGPTHVPPSPLFVQKTFAALGISGELVSALEASSISLPTGIQSRGIPTILGGADVIMGAATGSGKTLAYLLPVVQMLKQAEGLREDTSAPLRVARRPRALIIVPTRELAEQVVSVAKGLAHLAKFRVVGAIGGTGTMRALRDKLAAGPVDVLVCTTGRLLQLLDDRAVDVRFASHVVIDEVDTMFDAGFGPELKRILRSSRGGRTEVDNKPQYIAAGATHPRAAEEVYAEEFPDAKRIDVDLHRPPPGLEQRFITVAANAKLQELLPFLGEAGRDGSLRGGRMIVFCNTVDSCRFLDHFLAESGYTTSCVHGDVPPTRRDAEYKEFKEGKKQLLVCTDMAARGLDNLSVDHVVLFDFPGSAVDYLHRAGRTARAGAKGRVTSFVTKKDTRLAKAIEKASIGRDDALESARRAREEEMKRKRAEEEAARENTRRMAEAAELETEDRGVLPVGRSSAGRVGRGRGAGRSERGSFSFGRGGGRGRGGRGRGGARGRGARGRGARGRGGGGRGGGRRR